MFFSLKILSFFFSSLIYFLAVIGFWNDPGYVTWEVAKFAGEVAFVEAAGKIIIVTSRPAVSLIGVVAFVAGGWLKKRKKLQL